MASKQRPWRIFVRRIFRKLFSKIVPVLLLPLNIISLSSLSAPFVIAEEYSLFNPLPADKLPELAADRPDTTESAISVPAGHMQLEMSVIELGYNDDGSGVEKTLLGAPFLLKLGIVQGVDLQVGLTPYERQDTTDSVDEGSSDLISRLKLTLLDGEDALPLSIGLLPFLEFPTGNGGNSSIEGGMAIPVAYDLAEDLFLGGMLEADLVRSLDADKYRTLVLTTIEVGTSFYQTWGSFVEYAGVADLSGEENYQGAINVGLTNFINPNLQIDCGLRIGVTEAAPDIELFLGFTQRI